MGEIVGAGLVAQGHHPRCYSKQYIDAGITKETATIGRQTFGVTP